MGNILRKTKDSTEQPFVSGSARRVINETNEKLQTVVATGASKKEEGIQFDEDQQNYYLLTILVENSKKRRSVSHLDKSRVTRQTGASTATAERQSPQMISGSKVSFGYVIALCSYTPGEPCDELPLVEGEQYKLLEEYVTRMRASG
jgi:hypothetical protein